MKRFLSLFLALLLFPSICLARTKYQGYVQQGNGAVKVGGASTTVTPNTSNRVIESFPNCTVTVYVAGTLTLATLYSDNAGTSKANPFTADTTGFYFFYVDDGRYDIRFSGTGITTPFTIADVSIGTGVPSPAASAICNVKDPTYAGGAKGDGTTDDTAAIQAAINCTSGTVFFPKPSSYYKITDTLTVAAANTHLYSNDKAEIRQATSAKGGLSITASGCSVTGLKFTGPQYATSVLTEAGILAAGSDSSHYLDGLKIEDVEVATWGGYGIGMTFVKNFSIYAYVHDIYYAAIAGTSCQDGTVDPRTWADNVIGTPNAYGMIFTGTNSDSLVTNPRSKRIIVSGRASNVPNWECFDTHAGEDITFLGVVGYKCKTGLLVGSAPNSSAVDTYAPLNVSVVGGVLDSGVTDGSMTRGLVFQGVQGGELGTGSISGVTIKNYGVQSSIGGSGIYTYATEGLTITGNSIINPSSRGILVSAYSLGTVITGNTIKDVWSNTVGVGDAIGIITDGSNTTLTIAGNSFTKGGLTVGGVPPTYLFTTAIKVNSAATAAVKVGANQYNGVTLELDQSGSQSLSKWNFTLANNKDTVVSNTSVTTMSHITLIPTNAAAATLMSGSKSLYISARTAGTSFTVTTADGTAAAGTETFTYMIE